MKETFLRDYLYDHPEILFPGQVVQEKAKEYYVQGKRIDLLFRVDGARHIVEVKGGSIEREHIGQVVEYYGRMKGYLHEAALKMILVSPHIPSFRSTYLEELGIRCVEIKDVPESDEEMKAIQQVTRQKKRIEETERQWDTFLSPSDRFIFGEVTAPVSPKTLGLAKRILQDSLPIISVHYSNHEIAPKRIMRSHSHEVDCVGLYNKAEQPRVSGSGIWWAYSFGESHNDVPNISIQGDPKGLLVDINAELMPSEKIFLARILASPDQFDQLVREHGNIWFMSFLKLEHHPKAFHWILIDELQPGSFSGKDILRRYDEHKRRYDEIRGACIEWIERFNQNLSPKQVMRLRSRSKNFNLALRLVKYFKPDDQFWSLNYQDQLSSIIEAVNRMKPLVDFFLL